MELIASGKRDSKVCYNGLMCTKHVAQFIGAHRESVLWWEHTEGVQTTIPTRVH